MDISEIGVVMVSGCKLDRRDLSGAETRAALDETPNGYVYSCPCCGGDMIDDSAHYHEMYHEKVCEKCAC